jgi:hypothetical protein
MHGGEEEWIYRIWWARRKGGQEEYLDIVERIIFKWFF